MPISPPARAAIMHTMEAIQALLLLSVKGGELYQTAPHLVANINRTAKRCQSALAALLALEAP